MHSRRILREIVLRALFIWDFYGKDQERSERMIPDLLREFAPKLKDHSYIQDLYLGIVKKQDEINSLIEKVAPDWPIDRIALVDRNILRIGIFELLFSKREDVPPKVAINESIELAKSFGGQNSYKFVSGVLGAIYELFPERKKSDREGEKIIIDPKVGAVVFSQKGKKIYLGMVHDIFGKWTLSKGSPGEKDGSLEESAKEKIKEEMGLDVEVLEKIGKNSFIANDPERGKVRKNVTYFLARAEHLPPESQKDKPGIVDTKWFELDEIKNLSIYKDILPIIEKGINLILEKYKK